MIYTSPCNPLIDNAMYVEELIYDDVNRIAMEKSERAIKAWIISRG